MTIKEIEVLSSSSLLYVEEVKEIQSAFREELKYVFKNIYLADNGDDAYILYQEKKPDYIITNLNIPNLSGVDLIRKIRQVDSNTKIAVVYSSTEVHEVLKITKCDISKIIYKPLTSSKLYRLLKLFSKNHINEKIHSIAPFWIFNSKTHVIHGPSVQYILTKKECLFLSILFKQNKLMTYFEMEDSIWAESQKMTNNAIRLFIRDIRKKLPPKILLNIPGVGYRIVSS